MHERSIDMDLETKRRLLFISFLCMDAMIRVLLDDAQVLDDFPAVVPFEMRKRKRDESEEFDDGDVVLAFMTQIPGFGKRKRRFWSALRSPGAWNDEVIVNWNTMGVVWDVGDWEDQQYRLHLRMPKSAFWALHAEIGALLDREVTNYRLPISSAKRLAITLHWLSHGTAMAQLSLLYGIGKSTAVSVTHDTVHVLRTILLRKVIRFPTGKKLRKIMKGFKGLCGLPRCAGAIDGTFMRIRKPEVHGDAYWCYQRYPSIIILACVDHHGHFSFVDAGRPGSLGDAATYHASRLAANIANKTWLTIKERGQNNNTVTGTYIRPYLVGDSAFPLSQTMMKCHDDRHGPLQQHEHTFNFRLIRTRRVVEQAFGRLKGRFRILDGCDLRNPTFAADVALSCCALHNFCESWATAGDGDWRINDADYEPGPADIFDVDTETTGAIVREKLSHHVHMRRPVH